MVLYPTSNPHLRGTFHINSYYNQGSKKSMVSSFFKYKAQIEKTLGSHYAALLFSALEFRFESYPNGFYKFTSPCNNPYYKKGDSLEEELKVSKMTLWRASKKICTVYKSKTQYLKSLEIYGDVGVFQGKPFLSYLDNNTHRNFYLRNKEKTQEIYDGTYKIPDKNNIVSNNSSGSKCYLPQVTDVLPAAGNFKLPAAGNFKLPAEHEKHYENNVLQFPKNTNTQRRPLSPSLSSENLIVLEVIEQPKEEIKNEEIKNTKQPSVSLEIIDEMIDIWRRIVSRDLDESISKATYNNLEKSYVEKFSSSLSEWKRFCSLCASSKYLMGETTQQFKLNIGWASKLDSIEKITNGHFSTGDRAQKIVLPSQTELHDEILRSDETQEVKDFRALCLRTFGNASYISNFKPLTIEFRKEKEVALIAIHKFAAEFLMQNCYSYLRRLLEGFEDNVTKILILAPGETRGRLIERQKEIERRPNLLSVSTVEHTDDEELSSGKAEIKLMFEEAVQSLLRRSGESDRNNSL
jgi:hypothetical protein